MVLLIIPLSIMVYVLLTTGAPPVQNIRATAIRSHKGNKQRELDMQQGDDIQSWRVPQEVNPDSLELMFCATEG